MQTSFAIKNGWCLLLAACLCLGTGCATMKPAPKTTPVAEVAPAPDSAFVQMIKDWWNAAPPDIHPTSRDDWGGADLVASLLTSLGNMLCK